MTSELSKEFFDPTRLHEATDGDQALEAEVILLFLDTTESCLHDMERLYDDPVGWSETAHTLKGGCASIGAVRMTQLCEETETTERTAGANREATKQLAEEYARIKNYLAARCS
jgi:HPt (histidine-containing phosphotransfer) domain-containing protein